MSRELGKLYEEKAAAFLAGCGYEILARNFTTRWGELDIVARQKNYLVFLEVKYRQNDFAGLPQEAVNKYKQNRLARAAMIFLKSHPALQELDIRFDILAISGDKYEIIPDAFAVADFWY
jgi:putative endonuclease